MGFACAGLLVSRRKTCCCITRRATHSTTPATEAAAVGFVRAAHLSSEVLAFVWWATRSLFGWHASTVTLRCLCTTNQRAHPGGTMPAHRRCCSISENLLFCLESLIRVHYSGSPANEQVLPVDVCSCLFHGLVHQGRGGDLARKGNQRHYVIRETTSNTSARRVVSSHLYSTQTVFFLQRRGSGPAYTRTSTRNSIQAILLLQSVSLHSCTHTACKHLQLLY